MNPPTSPFRVRAGVGECRALSPGLTYYCFTPLSLSTLVITLVQLIHPHHLSSSLMPFDSTFHVRYDPCWTPILHPDFLPGPSQKSPRPSCSSSSLLYYLPLTVSRELTVTSKQANLGTRLLLIPILNCQQRHIDISFRSALHDPPVIQHGNCVITPSP
jgi:hypothetical protein